MKIVIDLPDEKYETLRQTEAMIIASRSSKSLMSVICNAVINGVPLDKIRAEIKEQLDYHDNEHRKYDSEEDFGISLGLELALATINKALSDADGEVEK